MRFHLRACAVVCLLHGMAGGNALAHGGANPDQLLREADRLAWMRAWTAAEPIYLEGQKAFEARGETRSALLAMLGALRGRPPRMPAPEASAQVAALLEGPQVRSDDALRLRCLVIKGEIDEDLDPTMAGESWREAQALAEKLGEASWANRAKGELGLVAFLLGDVNTSVASLGQALMVAQSNGDSSSVVRWLTLFGLGYSQLGRQQEAMDFYDRALKVAAAVPEMQFPVMTHMGRARALIGLARLDEAERVLAEAGEVAARAQAIGYQAQLLSQRAAIAAQRRRIDDAIGLFGQARHRRSTPRRPRPRTGPNLSRPDPRRCVLVRSRAGVGAPSLCVGLARSVAV